jgi:hypothetical protein
MPHSDLPILTPEPPRKSQAEKYGGLYYAGIAGLVVLLGLVGWFAHGVWSLRGVFRAIYVLNDPRRAEEERVRAAYALARDPRVTQRQLYDGALSRVPPDLARYLLAEALTSDAIRDDPRAFAMAVARSEGWPDWLRLLMVRPLAYGAGQGYAIPAGPLDELRRHPDPAIRLWAAYTRAAASGRDIDAARELGRAAERAGPEQELAAGLRDALGLRGVERDAALDRATLWLRRHHPEAARLWDGWEDHAGRLVRRPAPKLRVGGR